MVLCRAASQHRARWLQGRVPDVPGQFAAVSQGQARAAWLEGGSSGCQVLVPFLGSSSSSQVTMTGAAHL